MAHLGRVRLWWASNVGRSDCWGNPTYLLDFHSWGSLLFAFVAHLQHGTKPHAHLSYHRGKARWLVRILQLSEWSWLFTDSSLGLAGLCSVLVFCAPVRASCPPYSCAGRLNTGGCLLHKNHHPVRAPNCLVPLLRDFPGCPGHSHCAGRAPRMILPTTPDTDRCNVISYVSCNATNTAPARLFVSPCLAIGRGAQVAQTAHRGTRSGP